ncbi:MAG: extracellular solute-binding protein [Micrococcales bacterium]|nr:extracellular solute-binding protein [Micrococcales bacterium]
MQNPPAAPHESAGPDHPESVPHGRVRRRLSRMLLGAVAVSALVLTAGCGSSGSSSESEPGDASSSADSTTLTVYTDQHAELIEGLTKAYTNETGVKFNIQQDATVGQIQAEGDASKADVFLSEDPGSVALLGKEGLLAPVEAATLAQVRPGLSSGKGLWVAYAARTRVLFYNPTKIKESALPKTLADITEPQYKGKFAWAPSGAFVATTQYLISTIGVEKTTEFLEALKANGVNEQKNGNVRDTVEAGKHAMGLSNHYYWWILAGQKGGPENLTSKIYHFPTKDPGNLILSSGAGVLKSSPHAEDGQKFLAWLTSKDGGQKVIAGPIDVSGAQYPVAKGVSSSVVGDLSEVKSPAFDMDELANSQQAEDLLKKLGMSRG